MEKEKLRSNIISRLALKYTPRTKPIDYLCRYCKKEIYVLKDSSLFDDCILPTEREVSYIEDGFRVEIIRDWEYCGDSTIPCLRFFIEEL